MLRTHTCGELSLKNIGQPVSLCGWVHKLRNLGGMTFIDIRDRYGLTQLIFNEAEDPQLVKQARALGREFVIRVRGIVVERSNKNTHIPTGAIEIKATTLELLNPSKLPPFLIEDISDGGEELRAQYRYLDLRRKPLVDNLLLRHRITQELRKYLDQLDFIEIETPLLIQSTPEGARDFVVPSRLHPGCFYALPQSPQILKQLLMVSSMDRYFQLAKCFRDEDLRADRQPEFTQLDCEMAFVTQEDIFHIFENMVRHLFKVIKNKDLGIFPRMSYADALHLYGSDKPDIRFGMQFVTLNQLMQGKGMRLIDHAASVIGINAKGCAHYTRKQLDELITFVQHPPISASGLIYVRYHRDQSLKSSVDRYYQEQDLQQLAKAFAAAPGDLLLIMAGDTHQVRTQLSALRLEMGKRLGLLDKTTFAPLWIVDFPLLVWNEAQARWQAMHHPFTAPKPEDEHLLLETKDLGAIRAQSYDLVINGTELGGGSIRIHDKGLQEALLGHIGISEATAQQQFGTLLNALAYGAPPHGGIAFGLDRLCALLAGLDSIRDVIAFPKNNAGRDVMTHAPTPISVTQLQELHLQTIP